jgi:hypothetical protein
MRRAALLLVLALAAPAPAQKATPGQVAYVEGVRAFDAGDYATAAARMRVALAEDPVEATARFRYRAQNAEDYFPHLWLGLSLEKTGDADGARAELRESERQGAAAARPATRRVLAAALARLAPPAAPTPAPAPALAPTATPRPELQAPTAVPAAAPAVLPKSAPTPLPARAAQPTAAPPAPTSRAAVTAGLRAFFRADYEGAERLLAPEAARSPVARLYLAYALGGRHLLAREGREELLARARAEYAAAVLAGAPHAAGPALSPAIAALFGAPAAR